MSIDNIVARIPEPWYQGIDCGEGWYDILIDLDSKIAALDPNYTVAQVKEKFGGLRYYLNQSDPAFYDQIHALIAQAEAKAAVTCEVCGNPGTLRSGGWIRTLCDDCHANHKSPWA